MKKRTPWLAVPAGLLCCGAMLWVDGVWQPGYLIKSTVKLALFLLVPLGIACLEPEFRLKTLFRPNRKGLGVALGLGAAIYTVIVGGFFLLRPFVDFSGIAGNLSENAGVTRENFLLVSLYISFANSLLEEFFFRGFLLRGLSGWKKPVAWGFSAAIFALYHTAMMAGWFDWWMFALAMVGLMLGGLIFSWLNRKQDTLYTSWLCHMFANFAINTVGFILL